MRIRASWAGRRRCGPRSARLCPMSKWTGRGAIDEGAGGRGSSTARRDSGDRPAPRGYGGRRRVRRARGAGPRRARRLRRGRARSGPARGPRRRGLPGDGRRRPPEPGADADGGRFARGPSRGPRDRGRRLPAEAVPPRRAGRADSRAVTPIPAGARRRRLFTATWSSTPPAAGSPGRASPWR